MHFGEHVTLDGYGGDFQKLNDSERVLSCLTELPILLGMRLLSEPQVYHAEDNGIKDPGGWTGVVTIAESHISVHTFPRRGFVSADVYTCKNGMDTDRILAFFKDIFDLKDIETHFLKRGTHYPQENIY
jgi:S-adenosylmethionine decarboxylase